MVMKCSQDQRWLCKNSSDPLYNIRVHWYPWYASKKSLCCCMPTYELSYICEFVLAPSGVWDTEIINGFSHYKAYRLSPQLYITGYKYNLGFYLYIIINFLLTGGGIVGSQNY